MRHLFWFLQSLLILLFTLPLAVIPYKISLKVGTILGSLIFFLWGSRRDIAIKNLNAVVSRNSIILDSAAELIIRENFRNLGRSFAEIVRLYYSAGERIIEDIEIRGIENFENARQKGKGIIFITGHCGNWELLVIALSKRLTRSSVVARAQNNPYINRIIERVRQKYGSSVIYKKGALRKILSSLKRNESVGILMDQSVVSSEGVVIDFLGKKAYTMKMPAIIARKTNSSVLPVFIKRVEGWHRIEIGKEIELDKSEDSDKAVLNDTIKFTGYIEEYIKQNPSEWLWMHRRWKRIKD